MQPFPKPFSEYPNDTFNYHASKLVRCHSNVECLHGLQSFCSKTPTVFVDRVLSLLIFVWPEDDQIDCIDEAMNIIWTKIHATLSVIQRLN